MPVITAAVNLGAGLLEVDYPPHVMDIEDYVLDDVVALSPSPEHDRYDLEFSADLLGADGVLVATVAKPPFRSGARDRQPSQPGFLEARVRKGKRDPGTGSFHPAPVPEVGTEVILGSGPVRLRQRTANGRPTRGERTAIGVGDALDRDAVLSVFGLWVTLQLRPPTGAA
jgi:hypothetical protein